MEGVPFRRSLRYRKPNGFGYVSRLFIVDQSLKEFGGHHFEYCRLLAESAHAAGVRPILGVHRSLADECVQSLADLADIVPVFRNTVYSPHSYLAGLAELKRKPTPLPGNNTTTRWRRFWSQRRQTRMQRARALHIRTFAEDCDHLFRDFAFDESDQVLFTTVSELDLLGLAAWLGNTPRTVLPTWHVQFHFSIFSGRPWEFEAQARREELVHDCLRAALARVPYHSLHFHTTSAELNEQYQRFPLVRFSELPYPVDPRLFECRRTWRTDNEPLRLTVAGGIRREKAQKVYLTDLIRSLWDSQLRSGKVQLHVQTGDPKAFSRKSVFGRMPKSCSRQSQRRPSAPAPSQCEMPSAEAYAQSIVLHGHPLPETEYLDLVRNSDIGLLYYDSRRYYSRRAGILSEFLASGKPVIVPAGCWLGRQIAEPGFQHAGWLVEQAESVWECSPAETNWDRGNAPFGDSTICFDKTSNPWQCRIHPELDADGVVVRFAWQWPRQQDEFVEVRLSGWDQQGTLLVSNQQVTGVRSHGLPSQLYFSLPVACTQVAFEFRGAFCDRSISLTDVHWTFLRHTSGVEQPTSRVGQIVSHPNHLAAAVAEIVRHYDHYQETAAEFGHQWASRHDPDCTLDALLDRESRYRRAS